MVVFGPRLRLFLGSSITSLFRSCSSSEFPSFKSLFGRFCSSFLSPSHSSSRLVCPPLSRSSQWCFKKSASQRRFPFWSQPTFSASVRSLEQTEHLKQWPWKNDWSILRTFSVSLNTNWHPAHRGPNSL